MTRTARFAFVVSLALAGAAPGFAQDVKSNYMPGTDFSKYKTYKWVQIEGARYPDQIKDAMIKQAVDSQLAAKGLSKVEGDDANMGTISSSTIQIGQIALDMYDPATKQLVWKGVASKQLKPSDSQEKNQQNLNKAMAKLLKNFPPQT